MIILSLWSREKTNVQTVNFTILSLAATESPKLMGESKDWTENRGDSTFVKTTDCVMSNLLQRNVNANFLFKLHICV